MALLGNFIGGALGLRSGEEYTQSVEAAQRRQELQRKEQERLNNLKYGAKQEPGVGDVPGLNTSGRMSDFGNLDQFEVDKRIIEEPKPISPQFLEAPDGGAVPPSEIGPKTEIGPDGNVIISPNVTSTGQERLTLPELAETQDSHLTLPDLDLDQPIKIDERSEFKIPILGGSKNLADALQQIGGGRGFFSKDWAQVEGITNDSYNKMSKAQKAEVEKKLADAQTWWQSDEAYQYFARNPDQYSVASRAPYTFYKQYMAEAPLRSDRKVARTSAGVTDDLITERANRMATALTQDNTQVLLQQSQVFGLDPAAVMAIFAIESNYGVATGDSGKNASGSMQVTDATFNEMKKWYTDPANIKKYNIPTSIVNMARGAKRGDPMSEMQVGLMRLKYNEYIGVPKNLWGAAYQANADTVLKYGRPLRANDGNITNGDYNRAYVELYNHALGLAGGGTATTGSQTPPAGVRTDTSVVDAGVDTTASASNVGKTATGSGDISNMQEVVTGSQTSGVTTQDVTGANLGQNQIIDPTRTEAPPVRVEPDISSDSLPTSEYNTLMSAMAAANADNKFAPLTGYIQANPAQWSRLTESAKTNFAERIIDKTLTAKGLTAGDAAEAGLDPEGMVKDLVGTLDAAAASGDARKSIVDSAEAAANQESVDRTATVTAAINNTRQILQNPSTDIEEQLALLRDTLAKAGYDQDTVNRIASGLQNEAAQARAKGSRAIAREFESLIKELKGLKKDAPTGEVIDKEAFNRIYDRMHAVDPARANQVLQEFMDGAKTDAEKFRLKKIAENKMAELGLPTPHMGTENKPVEQPVVEQPAADQPVAKPTGDSVFYSSNPQALGFDLQRGVNERSRYADEAKRQLAEANRRITEYERMAQIARISGNFDNYEKYMQLARDQRENAFKYRAGAQEKLAEYDGKIMYLQGMQALQEFSMGSTARASAVWSAMTNRQVRIVERSDGNFDIDVDGKLWKTMSYDKVAQTLQLTFDAAYRKSQQASATKRAEMTFEAALDMAKERSKQAAQMYREATIKQIEEGAANYRKQLELDRDVKFTDTPNGTIVYKNGEVFFFDPMGEEYEDINGDTKIRFRLIPITEPNTSATAGNDPYSSAYEGITVEKK